MTTQDQHAWMPPAAAGDVQLGYRGWPDKPLPQYVWQQARECYPDLPMAPLDLGRPWITATPWWRQVPHQLVIGFTDAWFELKVGLLHLQRAEAIGVYGGFLLAAPNSRWTTEQPYVGVDWVEAACRIAACSVFFGDCSALHVLAVALGKPALLMEPMEARWNPIFWPLGMDGPQVTCVMGNDGRPTFDARACAEALRKALHHV